MPDTYWDSAKIVERLDTVIESPDIPLTLTPFVDDATTAAGGHTSGAIDDFEDGDLSEYAGDTGSASAQTGTVYAGTYAGEVTATGGGNAEIHSTSGLPRYPQAGDTFEYRTYSEDADADHDTFSRVRFGWQDANNYYEIIDWISENNGEAKHKIHKVEGGSTTVLSETTGLTPDMYDEWTRHVVEWEEGGSFTCTWYDSAGNQIAQDTFVDSTFSDGGVGYEASAYGAQSTDATYYVDEFKITATTSSTGVIDDFEDNDMSEYQTAFNSGLTEGSIVTSTVYAGTYAREQTSLSDNSSAGVSSLSGLPRYPQAGDTFKFRMYADFANSDNPNPAFAFAAKEADLNPSYQIDILSDGTFRLRLLDSGGAGVVTIASSDISGSGYGDEWLTTTVDWGTDGSFTVTLEDSGGNTIDTISGTDSTYSGGGIGFATNGQGTGEAVAYFDQFEITSTSQVSETGVVDDFEDNDLSEYSGDSSYMSTQTSNVKSGTYSLKITGSGNYLYSTSGLPRYPEAGDTWRYWTYQTGSGTPSTYRHAFFYQDSNNHYVVDVQTNDVFRVLKFDGGNATFLASSSPSLSGGNWYEVKVEWGGGGSFTVTLYDEAGSQIDQITGSDATFSSGGIAHRSGSSGNESYVDHIRIV